MIIGVWLGVGAIAVHKTFPEMRVKAPFEWVGELSAGLMAVLIGGIAATAVSLIVEPGALPEIWTPIAVERAQYTWMWLFV